MSNKRLALENWLEIDPLISEFYGLKPVLGTAHWFAEALLGPELNPAVTAEVAEAFERARAVALYGVFAHSLYGVAWELLSQVSEDALQAYATARKVEVSKKGGQKKTMKPLIDELRKLGHLTFRQAEMWDAMRAGRNHSAHPSPYGHTHVTVGMFQESLEAMAIWLNKLFPAPETSQADPVT